MTSYQPPSGTDESMENLAKTLALGHSLLTPKQKTLLLERWQTPRHVPIVSNSFLRSFVMGALGMVVPDPWTIRRAQRMLRACGTLEGRRWIYDTHIRATLRTGHSLTYHDDAADLVWMRLDALDESGQLSEVLRRPAALIRVALALGLRDARKVNGFCDSLKKSVIPNAITERLVDLRVIRSLEEIGWLHEAAPRDLAWGVDVDKLAAVICALLNAGVPRREAVIALLSTMHNFELSVLQRNMDLLRVHGVDFIEVFGVLGGARSFGREATPRLASCSTM